MGNTVNASPDASQARTDATAFAADPVDHAELRHTLRNSLYSILLHVHCAQGQIEHGNLTAIAEHLASIRTAVIQSQQLADTLTTRS
jgi:hypothetical protein